jgi:type IV pilus assembly protein PilM
MSKTIVGIDIGSNSVRAAEVRGAAKGKPVIIRYHELPLPEGSVRSGEVLEITTVAAVIKKLWAAGGFTSKDVVLGMGGQRVFARELSVQHASLAQIRESLPFHVQDLLPVPVSDTILDFYPISEETTEEGLMVNGLLIAAIKDAVTSNVEAVRRAGLHPLRVDFIPFGLTRALAPIRAEEEYTALIGVGANTTNIVVERGGVPQFVRIIPSGGDDITRQLAKALTLGLPEAEVLKRTLGLGSAPSPSEQHTAEAVIHGVIGELLASIRNTLSYFATTKRSAHLKQIVVSGGGTQLTGFNEALADLTGLRVTRANLLAGATVSRQLSKTTEERQDAMSTAFGLALGTSA